jgi:hypothetical protein
MKLVMIMGVREIGWDDMDWIDLIHDSDQGTGDWWLLKKGSAP